MRLPGSPGLPRLLLPALLTLTVLAGLPGDGSLTPLRPDQDPAGTAWSPSGVVVEHLRFKVPAEARGTWLELEMRIWDPWLRSQTGYLGRELLWDPEREEGILLIRWVSRAHWHAIPSPEIEAVQEWFEQQARIALDPGEGPGHLHHPFPLLHAGELHPLISTGTESGAAVAVVPDPNEP